MRAHEKMLLNSKLMKAKPYGRHYGDGSGCALGMMDNEFLGVAIGKLDYPGMAENVYPWLKTTTVEFPCDCRGCLYMDFYRERNKKPQAIATIAHLFNEHVCHPGQRCSSAEPWTIERLADYIKSIDPTVDQDEEILCEQGVSIGNQEKVNS